MVLEEGRRLEGISLPDAFNKRYSYLEGRDDPMFEDESIGNSISCRVDACGHHVSKNKARQVRLACFSALRRSRTKHNNQIKARNHRKERDRVTRQELGCDVAKFLRDYFEVSG